ncbi:MAG: TRAP transporter permease, partial [Thermodesulfobacteriota bacterium]|nr:TRAP transporter permease [Thermodesulfobacteriota bacterium]
MSKIDVQFEDDGMDLAKKMAEEEEGIGRKPTGWQKWIIPTIAVAWSLYQLALPKFIVLDTTYIRAIHLAFALTLVYLNYPLFKKPVFGIKYFSRRRRIPIFDMLMAALACFSALYLVIFLDDINNRQGLPTNMDVFFGIMLTVMLMEAARRTIGPALPIIGTFFIAYCFLGPYMPDLIAFKGTSLDRFIG